MKIIAIENDVPNVDSSAFQEHLKNEAKAVWDLQQKNIIREIYFGSTTEFVV